MKSTPSLMPDESALACWSPVRTCALAGSSGSMFSVSCLGVTRLGRRVLFRAEDLLDWLDRSRTPLPKE